MTDITDNRQPLGAWPADVQLFSVFDLVTAQTSNDYFRCAARLLRYVSTFPPDGRSPLATAPRPLESCPFALVYLTFCMIVAYIKLLKVFLCR